MPTINKIKQHGVIYTPNWIVDEILNLLGYENNIHNKIIIDPACGDGAFLKKIVIKFISSAKDKKISNIKICKLLNNNIYGLDIDSKAISFCKEQLNIICKNFGVQSPTWKHILCENSLSSKICENYKNKFDFVVGNPPYVRIQNLSKIVRKNILSNFLLCNKGSTDIYIAFFELGFNMLNNNGKLGYITPSSFLNSAAGQSLRQFLSYNKCISKMVNFEHHQLFDDATTYSLITILDKNHNNNEVELFFGDTKCVKYSSKLCLDHYDEWILHEPNIIDKINNIKQRGTPLANICKIHTGIATLADGIFLFKNPLFIDNIARISTKDGRVFDIEKNILKKAIKASTWKSSNDDQKIYCIFPYEKINGKHKIIDEQKLAKEYPLTYKYFLANKNDLLKRDKGKRNAVAWYAFGRSQGLDTAFGKKIITAAINLHPRFIVCNDEDSLYYAGYSIIYDGDLDKLANVLNSDEMAFFIKNTSRDYQSGYKSYAKSFIKDFGVVL